MKHPKRNGRSEAKDLPVYKALELNRAERVLKSDLVNNSGQTSAYYTFKPEGSGSSIAYLLNHDVKIPLLNTAIAIETPSEQYIVVDMRPYTDRNNNIKNLSDANIMFANAAFEDLWVNEGFDKIESLSEYPNRTYIGIVAKILNSVYKLESNDLAVIKVIAGLHALYKSHGSLEKGKLATMISRYAVLPFDFVYDLIEKIDKSGKTLEISSVNHLADTVREYGESVKLKKFAGNVLMEQFYKIFYCTGHKVKLALAAEHFPMWISLVYAAAEDKRYKRTLLSSYIASAPRSEKDIKEDFMTRTKQTIEPFTTDGF